MLPIRRNLFSNRVISKASAASNNHHASGRGLSPRAFSTKQTKDEKSDDPPKQSETESSSPQEADLPLTFADISRAQVAIRGGIKKTYCEFSPFLSEQIGANLYLKPEFRQFTGSFKERGARNAILQLLTTKPSKVKGVIAASAGNHAQALAYHGKLLGVPATVVMPTRAPLSKVDRCRVRSVTTRTIMDRPMDFILLEIPILDKRIPRYSPYTMPLVFFQIFGARVILHGNHIGEAKEFAESLVEKEGLDYVNGYDDPPILAGAGTIGIEIMDDVPDVDVVVCPIGGAGLIAGIACAIKTLKPSVQVIGVEPAFCASYTAALKAGKPVTAPFTPTLADGLAVPQVGPHAFQVARHYVDECVLSSEKCIALAVLRLLENERIVVEGGGAAGLAGLLPGGPLDRPDIKGKNVVVPLCGGNIDTTVLGRVIERGLAADERLVHFYATVSDRPGGIQGLCTVLAEEGASIKDIMHERAWLYSHVDQVKVRCVVELHGKDHGTKLRERLLREGYPISWGIGLE